MKACLTEFRLFLIDTNIGFLLELYSPLPKKRWGPLFYSIMSKGALQGWVI